MALVSGLCLMHLSSPSFPHCACTLEGKLHGMQGGEEEGEREGDRLRDLSASLLRISFGLSQDGPISDSVLLSAKMSNCDALVHGPQQPSQESFTILILE